jgi:xylulokinase
VAAGGGAAGDLWPQIQADILEYPIVRNLNTEQACLGAAIVAGTGIGRYQDIQTAAEGLVKYSDRVYEPNKDHQSLYREYHAMARELYALNHDMFTRLSRPR